MFNRTVVILIYVLGFWFSNASGQTATQISFTIGGPQQAVEPGGIIELAIYVQVDAPNGFGGGPIAITFDPDHVEYYGTFNPALIIQSPFNFFINPESQLKPGMIDKLGGVTFKAGYGYETPWIYAALKFRALAKGAAEFQIKSGGESFAIVGGGTVQPEQVDFGESFVVTIEEINHPPVVSDVKVDTPRDTFVDIQLMGTDSNLDILSLILPESGEDYPVYGNITLQNVSVQRGVLVAVVRYEPFPRLTGTDYFGYAVSDGVNISRGYVEISVGPFSEHITVVRNGSIYTSLCFGASPGASDAYLVSDGDYLAPPPGMDGDSAFFQLDGGTNLRDNIVVLRRHLTFKMVIRVPDGESWSLNWSGSLPLTAFHEVAMTPMSSTWNPTGVPLDMHQQTQVTIVNDSGATKTYRFLISIRDSGTVEVGLFPGWNLIGIPLDLDESSSTEILNAVSDGVLWEWNSDAGAYVESDVLCPGKGYWIFADLPSQHILLGEPVKVTYQLSTGWNLVSPSIKSHSPSFLPGIVACWGWSGSGQAYIMIEESGEKMCRPGSGYWVQASAPCIIWSE